MFALALRSVLSNKRRFVGTAMSVMLGIAFLSGTLVFTDTMDRTFDDMFADIYAETDAVVRSSSSIEGTMGFETRGRIPESTVDVVLGVDGVGSAQGYVEGWMQLVAPDGDAIGNPGQGPPTFGSSYLSRPLGPWVLTDGSRAPGPGEVVVDLGSAKDGDLVIGDRVTVLTQTGAHVLPLVGIVRFGSLDSPSGASVALFDLATAQDVLLGRRGEIDTIVVDAAPGVGQDELTRRLAAAMPASVEVLSGDDVVAEAQDQMAEAMSFFGTFLLVFAVIGLVVACFTIFNTFQIVITQRIKEMALLRAIGATSGQVLRAQLVEAVVVGVAASAIGLGLGVLVASGLQMLMHAFGIDLPDGGTVVLPRTIVVGMVVGVLVTVVSAVFPAVRAARVPPIAALRDVALDRTGQTARRLVLGGGLTAGGIAAFVVGLTTVRLLWVGVGALGVFVGVFVLGPLLARPIAGPISRPLPALTGITGELARENAMRNPKRTARTGGALMVGVALVVGINVMAASTKDWIRDVFDAQFSGDFVVSTDAFGFGGLSPEVAKALNGLAEVDAATGIRMGFASAVEAPDGSDGGGRMIEYTAVDPATITRVFDVGVVSGALERLGADGVFVDDDEAASRDLAVGDPLVVRFADGSERRLTVEGIYTEQDLAGAYVVSHALHESTGADQFDFSVYVTVADGVSPASARTAIGGVVSAYANAELLGRDEYLDQQAGQIDPLVNLMYALLALAVAIALFSIANSVTLSIHERTSELGLLRAVGMTRRQLRSTVRWEAVLVAFLGTLSGIVLGACFGWAVSVTIRGGGMTEFVLPIAPILVVAVLAVVGTLLAVLRPTWRASRLDVLGAIAHA